MKKMVILFVLVFSMGCTSATRHKKNYEQTKEDTVAGIIAKDAVIQLVSDQFEFTEGPAADKAGNVYFTDQPNNKIWKYDLNGKLSVFLQNSGRSNGLYFNPDGNLLACADENNELLLIKMNGVKTVLLNNFNDSSFNGPNDVWLSPKGNIYFTDPHYDRPYWNTRKNYLKGQFVYLLSKQNKKPVAVATDLVQPNGIIGTRGGEMLYVADIGAGKTYRYDIAADGLLTNKTLFTNQGSDGMTIDNMGNIYLTGNGVTIYNKLGKKLATIPVPQKWTGNVCFGGADRKTLFITASKALYTLRMTVSGIN